MNFLLAVAAGAVQGLTEFLPISSTGHLIIFEHLFGVSQEQFGLTFDASLHLGTLIAVAIFFAKDYLKAISLKNNMLRKLMIGTIPAVLFGLLLENTIETAFRQIWVVATSLILFSGVMILAERIGKKNKTREKLTEKESFLIGFSQALALIPGVSRSGSTISAGLFLGMSREESAKFAFLLSGPIIAGAGSRKFLEVAVSNDLATSDLRLFVVGIISSAVFGYLTIKYLIRYLSTRNLYPFIYYRILLGIILLLFF